MALFQIGRALVSEPLLQAARPLAISALTQTQAFHVSSAPQDGSSAVFDKLGGKKAVKLAVEKFYEKVLNDPVCAPYFEGIDMAKQRAKQMNFMVLAFGGPNDYQGRSMYEAHKNMGLTDKEFNAVANHFVSTLKELGIDQKTIDEAAAVVETTRDAVLTRKDNC